MRAVHRQSGWSLLEVSVASAIGVLVLGASIALSATATEGTSTISRQATLRREGSGILAEFRDQLAQSGIDHIDVYPLSNGMSAVTYQAVVDHVGGRQVWGAHVDRVGTAVEPARLALEGLTTGFLTLPLDGVLTDGKTQFRVVKLPDGTNGLVKLFIASSGDVAWADVLARDIVDFQVRKAGNTLEVEVRIGSGDKSGGGECELEEKFVIVPRN